MSLDLTNMLFTTVLLARTNVERPRAAGFSVLAGMIPGVAGLLVPAIAARNAGLVKGGVKGGPGLPPAVDTGEVVALVPNVVGETEELAVAAIREAEFRPTLSTLHSHEDEEIGRVASQNPAGGQPLRIGRPVNLVIARRPEEEGQSESEKEDQILEVVNRIEEKVEECVSKSGGLKGALVRSERRSGAPASPKDQPEP